MSLSEVIKTALDQVQSIARTETIIGEPIKAGDVTVIPVSRVSVGFAAGGAGKDQNFATGAGTGGGINIIPVAFITIIGDKVQILPIEPGEPSLNKILSLAPDVMSKISKYLKKKDEIKPEQEDKK
ncbi:MAG: sporulation protein [Fibrobacter sp.]|nr:sporulation protein [Fibrobacter sp.]